MLKIIVAYLSGIVVEVNLGTDLYFSLFTFFGLIVTYLAVSFYKGHIKDIRKNIKDIAQMSFLLLIFLASSLYTRSELGEVSYIHLERSIYVTEGQVVSVKHDSSRKKLILKVDTMTDLADNRTLSKHPEYITVYVSPFKDYSVQSKLKVTGEINFENFIIYNEQKPLLFSYENMKLGANSFYAVSDPKNIEIINHDYSFYETAITLFHNVSNTLKNVIPRHMNEPYSSIAQGITLGDQEFMQKDIKDIFRDSGLIHILVLSGANVAFVISIIWFLLSRFRNKYLKIFGTLTMSWVFIFLTGLTAPSVRAGTMASTNIFAQLFSKNTNPSNLLLLALLMLTIISPLTLLYSASLHLSFLACYGIFILAPLLEKYICNKTGQKKNFLTFLLATFLGIFATITPYLLTLTGSTSLFGTVLTFLVEPLVMVTTILSFFIIIFSFVSFYLAEFFAILNTFSTSAILLVAEFGAKSLPIVSFKIPNFIMYIYYLILFIFVLKVNSHEQTKEEKVGESSPAYQEWYTLRK